MPDSEIRFSLPFIMWPNEMTNSFLIKKKNANPASHIHIVKCSASIQYWPREFLPDSFVLLASNGGRNTRRAPSVWAGGLELSAAIRGGDGTLGAGPTAPVLAPHGTTAQATTVTFTLPVRILWRMPWALRRQEWGLASLIVIPLMSGSVPGS